MENTPFHHVRSNPLLAWFSKKSTVNLMEEHGIDYEILPPTDEQISLLPDQYNYTIKNGHLWITFNEEKLHKRKPTSNALENSSFEELKVATVVWLNDHKPKVLRCKAEKAVEDVGGKALWTPTYHQELQTIELYW